MRCYTCADRVTQSLTQVGSLLLFALTVPSTHYILKIVFIFSPICRGCISLIAVLFSHHERLDFSQHHPPATVCHFFLLSSGDCAIDRGTCAMTFALHMLHKICRMKIFITIYFLISMQYKLIIGNGGACHGISIEKLFILWEAARHVHSHGTSSPDIAPLAWMHNTIWNTI